MHIREAVVAALVMECQALVIKAETVQDRRLHVVNVDGILHDVKAEVEVLQ